MFNISIISNNNIKVNALCEYLKKYSSLNNFKYKLYKYDSLDTLLKSHQDKLDILFTIIDLTDNTSFYYISNTLKSLYKDIEIIFMPEIVDFMLNGSCLKNSKYIIGPLKYASFEDELTVCINDLHKKNKTYSTKDTSCLLSNIPIDSILFIKSQQNTCIAYTLYGYTNLDYDINQLENILATSTFYRCHDNYIINIKKISRLNKDSVIINSKLIPVSSYNFKILKEKLLFKLKIDKN